MTIKCRRCNKIIPHSTPGTIYYSAELLRLQVNNDKTVRVEPIAAKNDKTILNCCIDCGERLGQLFGIYTVTIGDGGEVVSEINFDNDATWEKP